MTVILLVLKPAAQRAASGSTASAFQTEGCGSPSKATLRHTLWFPVQEGGVLVPWINIELIYPICSGHL